MGVVAKKKIERGENAMAGGSVNCQNLSLFYGLSPKEKNVYLETDEAVALFKQVPTRVGEVLKEGFLLGIPLCKLKGGAKVVDYFKEHSDIVPALIEYPGTFTLLDKMYSFESVNWPLDLYILKCKPGGQALRNRYDAVNDNAITHIKEVLTKQDTCLVLDLGSGPGRNAVDLSIMEPSFREKVMFDCVDTDPAAITKGCNLISKFNLTNINFVEISMARLHRRYKGIVDYGLLIGVLCGLNLRERVGLLKVIKPYFKKGARVIGAGLLDEMLMLDLLCSYLIKELAGWILQYPPIGMTKKAFQMAGYEYEGYFQDEPTRCYEIGIGVVT